MWAPALCRSASPFSPCAHRRPDLHSFPTRRSSDLLVAALLIAALVVISVAAPAAALQVGDKAPDFTLEGGRGGGDADHRSEEHTSELQSRENLVCRLLLEKKKNIKN